MQMCVGMTNGLTVLDKQSNISPQQLQSSEQKSNILIGTHLSKEMITTNSTMIHEIHKTVVDTAKGKTAYEDLKHIYKGIKELMIDVGNHKIWYLYKALQILIVSQIVIFYWVISWSLHDALLNKINPPWNTNGLKSH